MVTPATPVTEPSQTSVVLQHLWLGVRQQDYDSLTRLYRLMYGDLMNFGLRFGHGPADTKDAINQVFLELWERNAALIPVDNVRSYLITYLRRKLLRDYERGSRLTDLPDSDVAAERSYEDMVVAVQQDEELRQRLRRALAQLTPRQKELIEMRFFQEMTNEAISQQTGMHINTVYNTMSSALKTLRQTLGADNYQNYPAWWPVLLVMLSWEAVLPA